MRVAATLTIRITYDDAESTAEVREQLDHAAKHLSNVGLLSGDSPMTVDTWSHEIDVQEVTPGERAAGKLSHSALLDAAREGTELGTDDEH